MVFRRRRTYNRRRQRYGVRRRYTSFRSRLPYRRRSFVRRGKYTSRSVRGAFLPRVKYVKLKYAEHSTRAEPTVGWTEVTYRANSIYDPNLTDVGSLPSGYTQVSTLYNIYKVQACKIRCRIRNLGPKDIVVGLRPVAGVTDLSLGTVAHVRNMITETRDWVYKIIPASEAGALKPFKWMKGYKKSRQILTTAMFSDSATTAYMGSNPTLSWHWQVVICNSDLTGTAVNVDLDTFVTLYTKVFSPKNVFDV